jgi:hypothetical protein
MKIDTEPKKGHFHIGRSTRPSGCMTLQIGWLHGGANWHPFACTKSDWEVIADSFQTVATAQAGAGRRSLVRTPQTVADTSRLVQLAVARFNDCYAILTRPEAHGLPGGRCDFAGMMTALAEFDRIGLEVGVAGTTPSHFLRRLLGFAVADKLGAAGFRYASARRRTVLAAQAGLSNNQRKNRLKAFQRGLEARFFSGLFCDAAFTLTFEDALRATLDPFDAALAATLPTLQTQLSSSVLNGVYPPQARAIAGTVAVRYRNRRKRLRLQTERYADDDYVRTFLREIRNTHHGYGLFDDKFERLLACHSGEFGDQVADIALIAWHAVLVSPNLLTKGAWVSGLRVGRYRLG